MYSSTSLEILLLILFHISLTKSFQVNYDRTSIERNNFGCTYNYNKHRKSAIRNSTLKSQTSNKENESNKPSSSATDYATPIPKNLKRKVQAKRPFLGHVVPKYARDEEKKINKKNNRRTRGGTKGAPKLYAQGQVYTSQANSYSPSNLRIISGSAKGKRLVSPDVYLRPMMGKVRQALYSTLISFGLYEREGFIRHLDIFSGSGSVGLESLSRGATHCTFVDLAPNCCETVHTNAERCNFHKSSSTSYDVQCCDAFAALDNPSDVNINHGPYHIITICPPYEEIVYADLLQSLCYSSLVQEDTIIIVEYPVELRSLPHIVQSNKDDDEKRTNRGTVLVGIRNRKYGRTVLAMYIANPSGRVLNAESRPEEFGL